MKRIALQLSQIPYAYMGLFAVVVAAVNLAASLQVIALPGVSDFLWQVVTGCLLLAVLLQQFWMMRRRWTSTLKRADLIVHRWAGVAAVFLFALHAVRLGHIWMTVVTVLFFVITLTGVFNKEILRFQTRAAYLTWLAIHVAASVSILPLIAIHIWVALAY